MHRLFTALATLAMLLGTVTVHAEIVRWDNGTLIPGTKGITPGPGVDLSGWNLESHNLRYAALQFSALRAADLSHSDLGNAQVSYSTLTDANLAGTSLNNADLTGSVLTNANLTDAVVVSAKFNYTAARGFTQHMLYSTQSYQDKDLERIGLNQNSLFGWDFSGQNLRYADFSHSQLRRTDLTGAVVAGANFADTTSLARGFTQQQLYSTRSYLDKDLAGIVLSQNDLTGWDFSGQNLSYADFTSSQLKNMDLAGAVVTGINLTDSDAHGFTQQQLYSTQSYLNKDLTGIVLSQNDLTGWAFSGQNLSYADFTSAQLKNMDLAGAVVTGINLADTSAHGFTPQQLYSTRSYLDKDLAGIVLSQNDLTGWDFSGQNLSTGSLGHSVLTNANLAGANLSHVDLIGSTITNANFSYADLRASYLPSAPAIDRDSIGPDGFINALDLSVGQRLAVRDDDGVSSPHPQVWLAPRSPIPVTIRDHLAMAAGGILELQFEADRWDSLISFEPGIPVQLGGALELTFAKEADAAAQVGHTLHLFNWAGVSPAGAFTVSSLYDWDLTCLYTTGEVTLLAAGGAIAGDSNGDGKVDLGDFGTLKDHFGAAGPKADGDANGDARVDLADFGLLKANFGKSAAPVPEPATVVLAVLGLAPLLLAQRRVLDRACPFAPRPAF